MLEVVAAFVGAHMIRKPALGVEAVRLMTNIPTDLLRTFVAVVDLRSFTKAAAKLGVT